MAEHVNNVSFLLTGFVWFGQCLDWILNQYSVGVTSFLAFPKIGLTD